VIAGTTKTFPSTTGTTAPTTPATTWQTRRSDDALATLVSELPPKERAAVLLKDVLDYPLTEVAEIADTTLGGVKAALHRGAEASRRSPSPS
jgi:DNA-directed RNA polymerase specialized sigma24 family protein